MDYCLEVTKAHILFDKTFNDVLLERMEIESDFILSCLEGFTVVTEEASTATNTQKTQSLWEKIKEFFKHLFGIFKEKTGTMYERNKRWMDENFNKLDKIDYTNLKIEMYPFWNMDMTKLKNDSMELSKKLLSIINNKTQIEKYKDKQAIKTELFKEYLDENGDLTNGVKNYFRVGNAKGPLKTVNLEGNALKEKVSEFKQYCFNYEKDTVPFIQSMITYYEKEIERIEKVLKTKPATESFCLVENAFYKDTEISYCKNFVVMEAEQPAQNQDDQKKDDQNSKPAQGAHKPTQVNVVNKTDPKKAEEDESTETLKSFNSAQLTFLKNVCEIGQLNVSALMTVMEEKFTAYMNAMKGIISNSGKEVDNTPAQETPKEGEKEDQKGEEKKSGFKDRLKAAYSAFKK